MKFRYGLFYGNSMLPAFPTFGLSKELDFKGMKPTEVKDILTVGDVLLYRSKGYTEAGNLNNHPSLTAHRLIYIGDDYVLIKGDNRKFVEQVAYGDIVGKIVAVWGWNKRLKL
jgi:hypothetical protein